MSATEHTLNYFIQTGKVPHALLFWGAKNSSLKDEVYRFAALLLASNKKLENHPDLFLLFPEGKLGIHPIESIRQLTHQAALAPFEAQWKIFIIHDAERMLPASSNALLKTLEEPPPQTLIFLLTQQPDQLLPTIRSRCQTMHYLSAKEEINREILPFLTGEQPLEGMKYFESERVDSLFETVMLWFRDRMILENQWGEEYLTFPDCIASLQKTPYRPLELIERAVKEAQLAYQRATKLSTVLEMLFLRIELAYI